MVQFHYCKEKFWCQGVAACRVVVSPPVCHWVELPYARTNLDACRIARHERFTSLRGAGEHAAAQSMMMGERARAALAGRVLPQPPRSFTPMHFSRCGANLQVRHSLRLR